MTVITARAPHSTTGQVRATLAAGQPLTTSDALAVASWWQAPRGNGETFATFACGLPVGQSELIDETEYALSTAVEPFDVLALDALRAWVRAR